MFESRRTPQTSKVRRRGFTLIEVLVVVAIIALLISILLPSLNRAREQSRAAVCLANLHQCGTGFGMYSQDDKGHLPMRGGYNYNIKETQQYHLKGGGNKRTAVNFGALYGRYTGKEGKFYYCPANMQQSYGHPQNGWVTFFAERPSDPNWPRSSVTWGGYGYAAPIYPGNSPLEDPVIRGTLAGAAPTDPDKAPGAWRQATQPKAHSPDVPWGSYGQWLLDEYAAGRQPYIGKLQALMTDQLIGQLVHMKGAGQNVLYTDYHAKWVNDTGWYIKNLGSITSGLNGQPRLYAAWNWLSKRG